MRISYSALNTYQICPLKYKFQYIDKIKTPKSKEAVFGTLIHSTLNFVHTPGILSPSLEQSLDYFSKNWNSDVFENEQEERAAFSQGVDIIRRYYRDNDISKINIVALESPFQIKLGEHVVSGIIDRIDRTDNGYEIIDYKTAKKMPSQEKVDNDIQLTIYLKAFLNRYPEERKNLDNIKVSLYFVKHGAKLSSKRNEDHLKNIDEMFLEAIKNIEKSEFNPVLNPLCDWCDFQDRCPMQKHKFKEKRKIDTEEINEALIEYIKSRDDAKSLRYKMLELQEKISDYMDQEGVERVFSDEGIITRTLRKTYKYDEKRLKEILDPLGKWEEINKVNGTSLNGVIKTLPAEAKREIEKAKKIYKETESFSVKKQ
ncbi:MAG: PD-(D/E)XK nuclease family protein [Candidatus Moranbacteria bacterium]|jgi:RecB family exonuclease|nr:PD-(D/E)XK nuclease family protein [Candidatus Moranbacteria bacterium]MDD5651872.1 PD-(D/E)XK nuclease family protein [Candidatus Moranbacteria bacterium]MDX9855238.1 PD-(D/E)XK nuclease family protein [Candidatus Moranbacteria bacterium]